MTGSDLHVTLRSLEGSEDVKYEGSLIQGIAEMTPCEKTKEPHLRTISLNVKITAEWGDLLEKRHTFRTLQENEGPRGNPQLGLQGQS